MTTTKGGQPAFPLLEVRGLRTHLTTKGGARVLKAVDDLSFTLERGQTLAIVGESGSGKSITSLSIMGLLPKAARIVSGEILFDGEDLVAKTPAAMADIRGRRMSMILQDPMMALDPLFTIEAQLADSLGRHLALSGSALRGRMLELLDAVGISTPATRLKQYPHVMSGGMLQRIIGAIAISSHPELLIADEPTTALDPTVQAQFLDLLDDLKTANGLALIVITHDFGVAARLCDHVLVMYAGRAVEKGPAEDVFENPRHPYTQALLRVVESIEDSPSGRLPTIEGQPPDLAQPWTGCAFAPRCPVAIEICRSSAPPEVTLGPEHSTFCWCAAQ